MALHISNVLNQENMKYYVQFCIYQTLHFPKHTLCPKMKIEAISELDINSTKLIDASCLASSGIQKSDKQLLITGILQMKMLSSDVYCRSRMLTKEITLPFSNFISIPNEISEDQPLDLRYSVLDSKAFIISTHEILVSSFVIFQYVDEYISAYENLPMNQEIMK